MHIESNNLQDSNFSSKKEKSTRYLFFFLRNLCVLCLELAQKNHLFHKPLKIKK